MECGICLEDLGCAAYVASSSDAQVPDNVNRFPCGHAFHSSCAVQTLLTSRSCPTCRANLDPNHEPSDEESIVDFFHIVPSDVTMAHDPRMHRLRSRSAEIQLARRTFRLQLSDYNRMQDRMRHRRRQAIQEALGALRRRFYSSCTVALGRLQISLDRVLALEQEAWRSDTGEEPSGHQWVRYLARDASEYIGQPRDRCESMLDRRFWSLR